MTEQIYTLFLILGVANGGIIATLLRQKSQRTHANWMLATFIAVLLVKTLAFLAARAGTDDPFSWLAVPPVEVSLAYGPCIYFYLCYLVQRPFKYQDSWHFLPLLGQLIYYLVLHLVPPTTANEWVLNSHLGWVSHLESLLTIVSLTSYLLMSWMLFSAYQHWLDNRVSDAENYRLPWVSVFLGITSSYSVVWALFTLGRFWVDSSYQAHFLLFAAQSLLLFLLCFESWRHYRLPYPRVFEHNRECEAIDSLEPAQTGPSHASLSEAWYQQIIEQQCWKEPELTLAGLAARLGTNTRALSYALTEGRQENFNAVINRLRIDYVCEQIQQQPHSEDILSLAANAGFNSKTSFNRNFKRFSGMTVEQFRQSLDTKT